MRSQLIVLGLLASLQYVSLHYNAAAPAPSAKCALIIPDDYLSTCISYDAVNRAFNAARQTTGLSVPSKSFMTIETDLLGRTITETTRILAKEFRLPLHLVHSALPLINTRYTELSTFCPDNLKRKSCQVQRFREIDGSCNNLENPSWGSTMARFRRFVPPEFRDGISEPRASVTGRELPSARRVSTTIHQDLGFHDHAITVYLPAWGQLIDHDMVFGGETRGESCSFNYLQPTTPTIFFPDPKTNAEPTCCNLAGSQLPFGCLPIDIPTNDPFYSLFKRTCLEFVRSGNGINDKCRLGTRIGFNTVTSYIDASFVYGPDLETSNALRLFRKGQLRSNTLNRHNKFKDLLPPQLENPDAGCRRPIPELFCFLTGDVRSNQQLMLVGLHTIFMREHNRIALELSKLNPHWNDERIFQETRHIIAAIVQQITYSEFLPLVMGKKAMLKYDLLPLSNGLLNRYDPQIDASMPDGFSIAAYRFGHSLIAPTLQRWSTSHKLVASQRLSNQFFKPFEIYERHVLDEYLVGFMNQVAQAVDESLTQELTNHLFREEMSAFGSDLASLNIQRGRDNGIPSYNTYREFCGLPRAYSWDDLHGSFSNETLRKYAQLYASPDDIDFWSAGISERTSRDSLIGPVFSCILGHTFRSLRFGDRFWFENGGQSGSFSLDQVNEIRKVKLARLICDNSDRIETVQVNVMALPDHTKNPRVSCKTKVLPRINLKFWKEMGY